MKPTLGGKTPKDNSRRRFPGVGGRRNNPVNITLRRKEAQERQAAWATLSPREQLAALDRRLGEGQGAKKQRARLEARLKESTGRSDGREPAAPAKDQRPQKAKDRRELQRSQRPSK